MRERPDPRTDDDIPEVSLRLLEIFGAMMRSATTTEAADALGISQPAVSAALRQLEHQTGVTLFERTTRRLAPTAEARALYEEIRPVFGLMRGFSRRVRDIRLGNSGRLRIMATPPLGNTAAPRALSRFLAARPDVSVAYDVRRLEHVVEAVRSGVADLGLILANDRVDTVATEPLHRAHMVALVPAGGPLAAKAGITPEDLASGPMIGVELESNLGTLIRHAFETMGQIYRPRIEARYCHTAAILAAELGLPAVVDAYSAARLDERLVRRPFLPATEVRAIALTRRGVPRNGLIHSYVRELRALLDDEPGWSA